VCSYCITQANKTNLGVQLDPNSQASKAALVEQKWDFVAVKSLSPEVLTVNLGTLLTT
jgi:hypothetical protein